MSGPQVGGVVAAMADAVEDFSAHCISQSAPARLLSRSTRARPATFAAMIHVKAWDRRQDFAIRMAGDQDQGDWVFLVAVSATPLPVFRAVSRTVASLLETNLQHYQEKMIDVHGG